MHIKEIIQSAKNLSLWKIPVKNILCEQKPTITELYLFSPVTPFVTRQLLPSYHVICVWCSAAERWFYQLH